MLLDKRTGREPCTSERVMSEENRDIQFAVFAKLLFDELYDQFNTLRCEEDDGDYEGRNKDAEQTRKNIQENIARRAYDLVNHTIIELSCQDALDFSNPNLDKYEYATNEMVSIIPDMTEWPKED